MSKKEKLLERLKRNPGNVDLHIFKSALTTFGFIVEERGGKSSPFKYYHPDNQQIPVRLINKSKPIGKHHIKSLISWYRLQISFHTLLPVPILKKFI